jgi:heptosyltransferase-3
VFSNIPFALNSGIRTITTKAMRCFALPKGQRHIDLRGEEIHKILLVRPNFRLGNSILALPSIHLFRKNYPNAQIDFVGSPVSQALIAHLPVDKHYQVARKFPESSWAYPALLMDLRRENYDLAVEVSCSQSALGAFVVGLSGARLKVGREGKWDFWYDAKIAKPTEPNKYRLLSAFVAAMGLESEEIFPQIILSTAEVAAGTEAIRSAGFRDRASIVGVFVGGRKRHGKRWPASNFTGLVQNLTAQGVQVAVFLGPEERKLMAYFKQKLIAHTPIIFEPSLRKFAALMSRCDLFVTGDSGPMHLACALGVRTIGIFKNKDFHRWGPPSHNARIVHDPNGVSVEAVEAACLAELSDSNLSSKAFGRWELDATSCAATRKA